MHAASPDAASPDAASHAQHRTAPGAPKSTTHDLDGAWPRPSHEHHWRSGASQATVFTLEGPDGCGKSTLCGAVLGLLAVHRISARLWREPGSSVLGMDMREAFKAGHITGLTQQVKDENAAMAMQLGRAGNHMEQERWLSEHPGGLVLRDRSWASTVAYQQDVAPDVLAMVVELGCRAENHPALSAAEHAIGVMLRPPTLQLRDEGDDGLDMSQDRQPQIIARYQAMMRPGAPEGWLDLDAPLGAALGTPTAPGSVGDALSIATSEHAAVREAWHWGLQWAERQGLDRPEVLARRLAHFAAWLPAWR